MISECKNRILLEIIILCLLSIFLVTPTPASIYVANGTELSSVNFSTLIRADPSLTGGNLPPGQVVFFTNSHCGACQKAKEFLETYLPAHPEITLEIHDIFNSTENRTLFDQYKERYNQKYLSTPSIMVGNITLEGTQDIRNHLWELVSIQDKYKNETALLSPVTPPSPTVTPAAEIPLLLIIGAGLLDGINPCAFAVLVILLVYLMAQKNRRAMISAGLVYSAAVFVFYFLSGVGIFTVIQTTGMTTAFSVAAGCIALIAGLLMMKDAILPGNKPTLAIPASQAGLINRVIQKATLPAAFILGILVGMFELPCTGGIYLSIISMISMKSNLDQALGYLFIYNLAFILPLLVILGFVTFGLPPERVNEFRLDQRRTLRGIIGLVLIGFAVFILYEALL